MNTNTTSNLSDASTHQGLKIHWNQQFDHKEIYTARTDTSFFITIQQNSKASRQRTLLLTKDI